MSLQLPYTFVIVAVMSIAEAALLFAGSNKVMSPVPAGTPTSGQALRVMYTPPSSISLPLVQEASRETISSGRRRNFTGRGFLRRACFEAHS